MASGNGKWCSHFAKQFPQKVKHRVTIWTLPFFSYILKGIENIKNLFSSVQSLSHVQLFATPWTATHKASLSITNSWSLLKLMYFVLVICHPTISSSVVLFSSRLQSFLASGSFPMSQFFTSGVQSIGVSASGSVLSMNIQDWKKLIHKCLKHSYSWLSKSGKNPQVCQLWKG